MRPLVAVQTELTLFIVASRSVYIHVLSLEERLLVECRCYVCFNAYYTYHLTTLNLSHAVYLCVSCDAVVTNLNNIHWPACAVATQSVPRAIATELLCRRDIWVNFKLRRVNREMK